MTTVDPATPQTEPIVGVLHIVAGTRLEDATPSSAMLTPPSRVVRGREGERLFILLDLAGLASSHRYRQLRELAAQAYWSASGSITAALRKAANAANRYLLDANLHSPPSERYEGGLILAVQRNDDLFILQAGSVQACFLHVDHLECFSRGAEPPQPLGIGPLADARLYHAFVAPGDTLLLAGTTLIQQASGAGLARVLPRVELPALLDGLQQLGPEAGFTALVVRWPLPSSPLPPLSSPVPPPSSPFPPPSSLGQRTIGGIRSLGRGIAAAGVWLVSGASTLFRRMLPGPGREARRRSRASRRRAPRPVPKENRTVMMAIAVAIPVVLAIVVALAYLSFGAQARLQGLINQAQGEVALAQAAGGASEQARSHWEAALTYAGDAIALRPDDPAAIPLQTQARAALDLLDGIVRLQPVQLWDFGPSTSLRRLVIHGQMAFVLDPAGGWVARLTLSATGDSVVEQDGASILVQTGQPIGDGMVGNLVDCVWVGPGGERQTSGLVILGADGALVSYDPAWVDEGGEPQLTHSFLGTSPVSPRAVGSYGGRFYILDTDANHIWRYDSRGDTYPDRPDRYLVSTPPRSLVDAQDMAIDGNIYVLYRDGDVLQFLQGVHQPAFAVRGLPGDIQEAVALAIDPNGSSRLLYVADRGTGRVVVLEPDGTFRAQFRADDAFDALEALAVDEAARRLYVVSEGRFYVASLP